MIELAPRHKTGLLLKSPIMPAGGFFGYGAPVYHGLLAANQFGALVTGPITLRPQPHQAAPQIVETSGGVLINTLPTNPGVRKIINLYSKYWRRLTLPIIAQLPADLPEDLARTAGALAGLETIAAFELILPVEATPHDLSTWIEALTTRSELPILVKLPFVEPMPFAEAAVEAGADTLVLGSAPFGLGIGVDGTPFRGRYYGAGLLPQLLPRLTDLHQQFPEIPLVACGGIHTPADARACLQLGAAAVQLDTVIFTNPVQTQRILTANRSGP
jgi:dihydroorotate dehydrogenase